MPKKVKMIVDRESFTRQWVCGFSDVDTHPCTELTPKTSHENYGSCGWRYVLHLQYTESAFNNIWGEGVQDA